MSEEYVINNFRLYFPTFSRKTNYCYMIGRFDLLAELDDGYIVVYNDLYHSARFISYGRYAIPSIDSWKNECRWALRSLIGVCGMSRERLCEVAGISQVSLSRYLMARATMNSYIAYKLAILMKCYPNEFLDATYYPGVVNDRPCTSYDRGDVKILSEEEWKKDFSDRLKYRLSVVGIDVGYFTELIKVSPSCVYKYLSGEMIPTAYALYKMSKPLNCSVDYLIEGIETESRNLHLL